MQMAFCYVRWFSRALTGVLLQTFNLPEQIKRSCKVCIIYI